MVQLNLSTQSYNFPITEGKMVPTAGSNEGGLPSNIKKTADNLWDKANFLKTHSDEKTADNVKVLSECAQSLQSQAKKDEKHIPKEVFKKIEEAQGVIKRLK